MLLLLEFKELSEPLCCEICKDEAPSRGSATRLPMIVVMFSKQLLPQEE
jgi:hypothetical protein